jgi:hypothetical protein
MEHGKHNHTHGKNCGHKAIHHDDHIDYLHDGHLHSELNGKIVEHTISFSATNPNDCTPQHACTGHEKSHKHGPNCGHEAIPHGDHVDYLVDGHLHHFHGDHCDNHGAVKLAN